MKTIKLFPLALLLCVITTAKAQINSGTNKAFGASDMIYLVKQCKDNSCAKTNLLSKGFSYLEAESVEGTICYSYRANQPVKVSEGVKYYLSFNYWDWDYGDIGNSHQVETKTADKETHNNLLIEFVDMGFYKSKEEEQSNGNIANIYTNPEMPDLEMSAEKYLSGNTVAYKIVLITSFTKGIFALSSIDTEEEPDNLPEPTLNDINAQTISFNDMKYLATQANNRIATQDYLKNKWYVYNNKTEKNWGYDYYFYPDDYELRYCTNGGQKAHNSITLSYGEGISNVEVTYGTECIDNYRTLLTEFTNNGYKIISQQKFWKDSLLVSYYKANTSDVGMYVYDVTTRKGIHAWNITAYYAPKTAEVVTAKDILTNLAGCKTIQCLQKYLVDRGFIQNGVLPTYFKSANPNYVPLNTNTNKITIDSCKNNSCKTLTFETESKAQFNKIIADFEALGFICNELEETNDKKQAACILSSPTAYSTYIVGYFIDTYINPILNEPYKHYKIVVKAGKQLDGLVKEAYERLKYEVNVSHILIKVDEGAAPSDTLAAYNRAMQIRKRILSGEDFGTLAEQQSDDPSAKDNGGNLGYFTVLQMVYPFETAAYNTPKGNISMPVRTNFGYHIITVVDKRPSIGEIRVAQIMLKEPKNSKPETLDSLKMAINDIYNKLKAGQKFDDLAAAYSTDKNSAQKGGVLPWFGSGKMVPEFEKGAFSLAVDGDFSKPIKTKYGWHIIKRIEKRGVPSFDAAKNDLLERIKKDSRSQ